MATTRIKEKLSQIVSSQFPEFVQSDHQKFIAFFEAYYKFLEQDQNPQEIIQNILDYNNIDFTTSAFIKYFLKNYAEILPDTLLADKKIAVKRIKDLYESKGSTLSFQLFFNIVFNQSARVIFPYENVLIPSGGNFLQRRSLRLSTGSGDRGNILDRFLTTIVDNQEFNTPILEVNNINDQLTEVFLDINFLAPTYTVGKTVTVTDANEGGNTLFSGNIESTTTGVSITSSGSGFKKGQIYTISDGLGGTGTRILVSNITSSGGINEVKILSFGHSYQNDFVADLSIDNVIIDVDVGSTFNDNTTGFITQGNVFYTANGQTVATFGGNSSIASNSTTSILDNSKAIVSFTLGALATLPGEFTTNKGFISDPDIRLQDSLLYQPFAYQLVTGLDINNFKDIILDTIHPAGQRLFNNRELSGVLDVRGNVSTTADASSVVVNLFEKFAVDYGDVGKEQGIGFTDVADLTDGGVISTDVQTYFAESYCVNQNASSADSYIGVGTEHF